MSFSNYFSNAVTKISKNPRKAFRIFDRRYVRHLYWAIRFGTPSDLHKSRWEISDDVSTRKYKSYEEYRSHQASKIDDKSFRKTLESLEDDQYNGFRRRFQIARELIGRPTILCLGARLGTEVRALKDMGHFAVGIDLNPGSANTHVLTGDFHNLAFGDSTVDVVYTNVLDHAFDLNKVMEETKRVLKPDGVALFEIIRGIDEDYLPQEYEAMAWKTARGFAETISNVSGMKLITFRSHGEIEDPFWSQAVFSK